MKRFSGLLSMLLLGPWILSADEAFTVMVYNVENLFDLDGVALYPEYEEAPEGTYGIPQLLGKLSAIYTSLAAINDGGGPEIVMFQEFELDRTPFDTPDPATFLELASGHTLEEILIERESIGISVRNLPSELLLLKYLEDQGLTGYQIAQPDPFVSESHPPHKNVVFSRFPIKYVRQRPVLDARDVLVVGLDVLGRELVLLNNHWKSGASSPELEPVRVQNAMVTRAEVDAILQRNPSADIIVAGDLNCYYNHSAVFPELPLTSVNNVLRSTGREVDMVSGNPTADLYNLWFELPAGERGSEVWRGYWGTLMQMLISQGLYDGDGIRYVDNSFKRLMLPGFNVESRWGRPLSWTNFGGGSGVSDHLPVYARFKLARPGDLAEYRNLSNEAASADRPRVDLRRMDRRAITPVYQLSGLNDEALAKRIGELFMLDMPLSGTSPARIMIGDRELMVYSPIRDVRDKLDTRQPGDMVRAIVELDTYRSQPQLVIADETWLVR